MMLSDIKGIGPKRLELLHATNIFSLRDILYYFPYRYKDTRYISPISSIVDGDLVTIECFFEPKININYFNGINRTIANAYDNSGKIKCVWFNCPWIKKNIKQNKKYILYGRVYVNKNTLYLSNPSFEKSKELIPVYKKIKGLSNSIIQGIILNALENTDEIEEIIPSDLIVKYNLLTRNSAIFTKHFPKNDEMLIKSNQRFIVDNTLIYLHYFNSIKNSLSYGIQIKSSETIIQEYWNSLNFNPTEDQKKCLSEIIQDLNDKYAMSRLLQGDVGSGKTAVALGAALYTIFTGFQCAYMAPTEVLAVQIYNYVSNLFSKWGIEVILLTSKTNSIDKKKNYMDISSGKKQMIVGTHALFTDELIYKNLGLIITDEQHRFGVSQRKALENKNISEKAVNVLLMSATPIPRSTALILLKNLSISTINNMPEGRKIVKTAIVSEKKRDDMYNFIKQSVDSGKQAYIICKHVENKDDESLVYDVKEHFKTLSKGIFRNYKLGILYGKQKPDEKRKNIEMFENGEIDILIATTVVEVGVNVPNANIIVIENADMYGLSQLHQLRGRVGRDGAQAWCFLMAKANDRLMKFTKINDGFEISKLDFFSRGPGEILGLTQHGESELSTLLLNEGAENIIKASSDILNEIQCNDKYEKYLKIISKESEERFRGIKDKITFS